MFYDDHGPPHVHVVYGGFVAKIEIDSLQIVRGRLPIRAQRLLEEWIVEHRSELHEAWDRRTQGLPLLRIAPLA
jgi:hypothetical protein